jgi:DNA-binding transcriptional LysR family regulator
MVLTEAGRLLLARTSGIVRQIDQIRDDIQSHAGAPVGRVVLGLVPTVSCVLSARLARRMVESYAGISLCIVESYSGHLIEWLHRGEMDLAVIYGPSADLHLSVQNLGRDAVVAVGPRGSGLARKKRVEMDWLLRQKLVLPSHSHGLRALIEHAAAQKKLKLDIQVEADSFRVLTSLVEEGLGFALLPPSSVRDEVKAGKLEVAIIAKEGPMRELIIASPIDHPGSAAIAAVTALLRSETAACRDEGTWDIKLA